MGGGGGGGERERAKLCFGKRGPRVGNKKGMLRCKCLYVSSRVKLASL